MSKVVRDLQNKRKEYNFAITDIAVGNLEVPEVNQILMTFFSLDVESRIHGLAEICYKRTLGNVLYLLIFVSMLQEQGLLEFNLGLLEWQWEDTKCR
jgi:hypothetical protein